MPNQLARERVLVTGATGFIGRHLLKALVDQGNQVYAATRSQSDVSDDFGAAVRWFEVDWYSPTTMVGMLDEVCPQVVFHLAGNRVAEQEEDSAIFNWLDNAGPAERLLECLAKFEIRRFITVGSAEEYGRIDGPVGEGDSAPIETGYGMAKAHITHMVQERHRSGGFPGVVLRPFSVYGPHQPQRMFVAQAIDHAVADQPFAMTEGRQRRDLVFIDDVVSALLAAAVEPGVEGKVFNIGTGKPRALREVAELIWQLSGTKAELQVGARPAPPEELHDTWADISRAREWLNWEPHVELEDGLRRTIEWARTQRSGERVA